MPFKNPEDRQEYDRGRREARRLSSLEYYHKNREERLDYSRQPAVRERVNARNRWRRANDPDYRARKCASYDKRAWEFSDDFTYAMLLDIRSQDCFYCGSEGGTADHLVPKSKGGQDRLDNLVPCCKSCNSSKGDRDLSEFYELRK